MMHINEGWLNNVRRVSSPNYDERPQGTAISLLVIHAISLPPGEFGGTWIEDLFMNRLDGDAHPYFKTIHSLKVSSHLLIDRTGKITQFVSFDKRAWHAGKSEYQGVSRCNDYAIGIELEGYENITYEKNQYLQLSDVTRAILSEYPAITPYRIVGHCHIAPERKQDPYATFDWDKYLSSIGNSISDR